MLAAVILGFLIALQAAQAPTPPASPVSDETGQLQARLLVVKRIYVDSFGDDPVSKQIQGMVVSALAESKRFVVTENKDKADAILRGNALEKTSQEFHALNDKAAVASSAAHGEQHGDVFGHSSLDGAFINGTGTISGSGMITGSSHGSYSAAAESVATDDSKASTETIDHARLAVRLVSSDGDVIWATTQESRGAKYKGASADVADKIVKHLVWDIDRAAKLTVPNSAPQTAPEQNKPPRKP